MRSKKFWRTACAVAVLSVPLAADAATLTHLYELNNSYADAFGGPSLVPNGGTLGGTGYTFAANQGLSLSNALSDTGDYSILLDFQFDVTSSYRKILDFKDLGSDAGVYNWFTHLIFYNIVGGSPGAFADDRDVRVVLTRDATTKVFTGYVDGVQQHSFIDTSDSATFSAPNGIMHFFRDDNRTGGEASGGFVDRIAIYGGALASPPTGTIQGPPPTTFVPLPASAFGGIVMLAGYGLTKLRRRKAEPQVA